MALARKKLGDLLVESGVIDQMQLLSALGYQRQWGGRLGRVLVQMRFTDEQTITQAVAKQLGLPCVRLAGRTLEPDVLAALPQEFCEKHQLLAFGRTKNERGAETIQVAMSDPTNLQVVDELSFRTGKRIEVAVAADSDIELAIRHHFYGESIRDQLRAPTVLDGALFAGHEVDLGGEGAPVETAEPVVLGSPLGDVPVELVELSETDLVATPGPEAPGGNAVAAPPLTMRERLLLDTIEAMAGEGGEPLPPRQMVAALVRLLIRKGLVTEAEFVAELTRK